MSFGEESGDEQKKQNFKYNGKELDKTHGLNQYDYAARYMDPATVRFTSVDPHAENYYSWSPYVYVGNNPMRLVDPTGMDPWDPPTWDEVKSATTEVLRSISPMRPMTKEEVTLTEAKYGSSSGPIDDLKIIANQIVNLPEQISETISSISPSSVIEKIKNTDGAGLAQMGATIAITALSLKNGKINTNGLVQMGEKTSKGALLTKTLTEQAKDLSNKVGKNSVEIKTPDVKYHYDLKGAPHKGIDTPHVQRSLKNTNSKTGQTYWNKDTKWVRSMTQQDIRLVRKFTNKQIK